MKKIVPFNNVLNFDTDVYEISAISLEHDIKKESDTLSGVFHITGEYKPSVGAVEKEKFSFELPFDIALGCTYNLDTLEVDIDDFRYELLDNNKLKVNIDLYIDGEEIKKEETREEVDLLSEMLKDSEKEEEPLEKEEKIDITNENENTFNFNNEGEEKYVTYHVYPVTTEDTLDKIMEKYSVTKEELAKYNPNLDIHPGDKLIIPANNDK